MMVDTEASPRLIDVRAAPVLTPAREAPGRRCLCRRRRLLRRWHRWRRWRHWLRRRHRLLRHCRHPRPAGRAQGAAALIAVPESADRRAESYESADDPDERPQHRDERHQVCLLYTSDAADDLTRVDLGG